MKTYLPAQASAILFRQLAAAERKQLPFAELLDILAQDPELFGADNAWLQLLARQLREGGSLTGALAQMPELLPSESAQLLQVAERQGKLAAALDVMADDFARKAQERTTLLAAITFPALMAVAFSIIFMMLMIFVIPQFGELFRGFGAELPGLTQLIIGASTFLADIWWLVLLVLLALGLAWYFDVLPKQLLREVEQIGLRLPFVRNYFTRRFISRLVRWIQLSQDVEFLQASLSHLRATESSLSLQSCIAELSARLQDGKPLGEALQQLPPLPRRLALFVQLGDKLGDGSVALEQLSAMSERETEDAFARFERGLTFSLYVTLGILVGVIVIAIYLPIFKMGSVL